MRHCAAQIDYADWRLAVLRWSLRAVPILFVLHAFLVVKEQKSEYPTAAAPVTNPLPERPVPPVPQRHMYCFMGHM